MCAQSLKWSPHPILKVPTAAAWRQWVQTLGQEKAAAHFARFHATREQAIALEKHDPLRHALFIPQTFQRATELMRLYDELLLMGGNREGKTRWAVEHLVRDLCDNPNRLWAVFHTTEKSSINQQQKKIYEMLPPEWRDLGKEGSTVYVKFTEAAGFGGHQKFILPNGSTCLFFNYAQKPSVLEGYEFDGVWFDELVPLEFVEAMEYRLGQGRRLQMLLTFTPVTGYTPVIARYLANWRLVESRPAPLLPNQVHVKGVPRGEMPYVLECCGGKAAAIFFHNGLNPYGAGREVAAKSLGKRPDEIMIRAYGWATKGAGHAFPRFDGTVHTLTRARFEEIARRGGTRYCVADPGDSKNWFIKWYFVTPAGHTIVYREWPDQEAHGWWATPPLTADKIEWRAGPAQRSEGGKGINDYKDLVRRLEGQVWREAEGRWDETPAERIQRRLIDPRLGSAAVPSMEEGTSIVDLMGTPTLDGRGRERWAPLYWDPAPGTGVFEGVQLLNDAMAYDIDQPVDATNCPRWYVVDDLHQTLRAYREYTSREDGGTYSQKDALKDIVDPDRYFVKSGFGHVSPELFQQRAACCY